MSCVEVAGRPSREAGECERGAAGQVVVRGNLVDRAPGVLDGLVGVSPEQRQPRSVHRYISREPPVLLLEDLGGSVLERIRCRTAEPLLRRHDELLDPVEDTGRHPCARQRVGEHRAGQHHRLGQVFEPRPHGRLPTFAPQHRHDRLEEDRRTVVVSTQERVPDRLPHLAVLLMPGRCSAVQLRCQGRLLVEQASTQHVREQVVVSVPVPTIVQGHEKQVVPVQGLQHPAATGLSGDGVAQASGHSVEHRRVQQELLPIGR